MAVAYVPHDVGDDLPQGATFLHGCTGGLLGLPQTIFRAADGTIVLTMDEPSGTFLMCRPQLGVVVDTTIAGIDHNMAEEGALLEERIAATDTLRGLLQNARCAPPANHVCTAACAERLQ